MRRPIQGMVLPPATSFLIRLRSRERDELHETPQKCAGSLHAFDFVSCPSWTSKKGTEYRQTAKVEKARDRDQTETERQDVITLVC